MYANLIIILIKGEEPQHYVFITRSHMESMPSTTTDNDRKRKTKSKLLNKTEKTKLTIEFEEVDCLYLVRENLCGCLSSK